MKCDRVVYYTYAGVRWVGGGGGKVPCWFQIIAD